MLRITARHADEWNTWGAPDMAGGALDKLLVACEQVERDPDTMWKSVQALVFMTDNAELAATSAEATWVNARSSGRTTSSSTRSAGTPSWASTS